MPYLGTFGVEFEKAIIVSEISTPEFFKNGPLTHSITAGPLYKVCLLISTYDLSTPHAHIPHNKMKSVIGK